MNHVSFIHERRDSEKRLLYGPDLSTIYHHFSLSFNRSTVSFSRSSITSSNILGGLLLSPSVYPPAYPPSAYSCTHQPSLSSISPSISPVYSPPVSTVYVCTYLVGSGHTHLTRSPFGKNTPFPAATSISLISSPTSPYFRTTRPSSTRTYWWMEWMGYGMVGYECSGRAW